jgi:Uma2 family endonuclease
MGSRTELIFEGQLILQLPSGSLADDAFAEFCQLNSDLRIERNSKGQILIMPPATSQTGHFNAEFSAEIAIWNRQQRLGLVFDSSAGFTLPNGSVYAPDAAWIARERWENLEPAQREKFAPTAPDFVAEIRSKSDALQGIKEKMEEYLANGVRLGWLINPEKRETLIYRPGEAVRSVPFEQALSGEEVLPGFSITLSHIF